MLFGSKVQQEMLRTFLPVARRGHMSNTCIVVVPRERFTPVIRCLNSIFETVGVEVPVMVIEGDAPVDIQSQLEALQLHRAFEHVALPHYITPNEARNIGAKKVAELHPETEFIMFIDNDISCAKGWLQALENNAGQHSSDVVSPLVLIGPTPEPLVHHAGGHLKRTHKNGRTLLREVHRFADRKVSQVREELDAPQAVKNEVTEFHGALIRRSFFEKVGGLDERLITREHIDLALRIKAHGACITFEKDAVLTYNAFVPFTAVDLDYHFFRWADHRVVQSLQSFEETWGIPADHRVVRFHWIQKHRDRALASYLGQHAQFPFSYSFYMRHGVRQIMRYAMAWRWGRRINREQDRARNSLQAHIPPRPEGYAAVVAWLQQTPDSKD